jgi:hypothetical protein
LPKNLPLSFVIPAQAGIQLPGSEYSGTTVEIGNSKSWIPACAGMTINFCKAIVDYFCKECCFVQKDGQF